MSNKLVSLILPVYNVERYLRSTLDSIISQTYSNIEIIAVDDCSTDSSLNILEEYKELFIFDGRNYKIIKNKSNVGVCESINKALHEASGDYLCFPDADDILHKEYVEAMLNELECNSNYKWVRCDYTIYEESENRNLIINLPLTSVYKNDFYDFVSKFIPFSGCNMMVEHDYFIRCTNGKLFSTRLTQEWSLVLTLSYHSNYARCRKNLYTYMHREHSKSSWLKQGIDEVLCHISDLEKLNISIFDMLNVSNSMRSTCDMAVKIFYELKKLKVYKQRNLIYEEKQQCEKLYEMLNPYVDMDMILKINEPDLLTRFAFDNFLEMNDKINLYSKWKKIFSKGYMIFTDKGGSCLYRAVCMAFG